MVDDIKDEPNTKVNIIVTEKEGDRYCIIATYTVDKYLYPCTGRSFVDNCFTTRCIITPFLKMFGINYSLDQQVKDGTCIAIKELKEDFIGRESKHKLNTTLTKIALDHKNKCVGDENGDRK